MVTLWSDERLTGTSTICPADFPQLTDVFSVMFHFHGHASIISGKESTGFFEGKGGTTSAQPLVLLDNCRMGEIELLFGGFNF